MERIRRNSIISFLLCAIVLLFSISSCGNIQVTSANISEHFSVDEESFERAINILREYEVDENGIDIIYEKDLMLEAGVPQELMEKYNFKSLAIVNRVQIDYYEVRFVTDEDSLYQAGIYYTSDGKPDIMEKCTEETEDQKYYVENALDHKKEIWRINDNWFYYSCKWNHGSVL